MVRSGLTWVEIIVHSANHFVGDVGSEHHGMSLIAMEGFIMRNESVWRLLMTIAAVGVLAQGTLTAQSATSASLVGKATDSSGAVLPGVTVTVTSPALQVGQKTVVTDPDGTYRVLQLPVGLYSVKFELSGFESYVQNGIRLSVGFTGRVDAVMQVGAVSESVTVSGESPVVDTVHTTSSTTFQLEVLQATPKGRGVWDIYDFASGVSTAGAPDVGDSNIGSRGDIKVYGVAQQATILVEGINAVTFDGPGYSSAQYIDYFPMNEVKVNASGADPETGTPGASVEIEMKGGSNSFHGNYEGAFERPGMQADNITPALQAQGLKVTTPLKSYYDFAGDLGGRIVRDKLWFYGGKTRQVSDIGIAGFAQSPGPDGKYLTGDEVPGTQTITMNDEFAKVSAQPWSATHLGGSYLHWSKYADHWTASRLRPEESTETQFLPGNIWRGEVQSVPKSTLLLNAYLGSSGYNVTRADQPGTDVPGNPSRFDAGTGLYTGPSAMPPIKPVNHYESHENITFLPKDPILGGRHALKMGGIFTWESGSSAYVNKASGDYLLNYLNQVPNSITFYNFPITPTNDLRSQALFAADTWTMSRVTLNLGVRWERYRAWYPTQSRAEGPFAPAATYPGEDILLWKRVVPRLGVAWDVRGNGKTVIKTTFGQYSNQPGYNFAENYNPNALVSTTYRWRDLNGNGDYNPGEVNLDPNGSDYLSATGGANQLVNPNLQQPNDLEFMARIDRELVANTAVSLVYVRKTMRDQFDNNSCPAGYSCSSTRNIARPAGDYTVPVTVRDPGPDGVLGNADDGNPLTLWTYPSQFVGAAFNQTMFVNAPSDRSDIYNTIEGTFTKRYSNRWNLLASFGLTKNHAWMPLAAVPQTPNDTLFPIDDTWNWNGRMTGSVMLPFQIQLAGTLIANSGAHGVRTVTFGSIPQVNTVTVRIEPFGSEQLPNLSTVNLRGSKAISLLGSQKLSLTFDVFNVFNSSAPTAAAFLSGKAFGFATGLMAPRIARLGVKFAF
jgi:hypothetical protein